VGVSGEQRQVEAEGLARVRETVQTVLRDWNWMSWTELLADDVVLSLSLDTLSINQIGGSDSVSGTLQVTGMDEAKRVLKKFYGDIKRGLAVTTELVSGNDALLLGNLALGGSAENLAVSSVPLAIYMAFSDEGRVEKLTIAAVDLQSMMDAIRDAIEATTRRSPALPARGASVQTGL
jgi:hypothetical protein